MYYPWFECGFLWLVASTRDRTLREDSPLWPQSSLLHLQGIFAPARPSSRPRYTSQIWRLASSASPSAYSCRRYWWIPSSVPDSVSFRTIAHVVTLHMEMFYVVGRQTSGPLRPSKTSAYASPQALLVLPPPSSGSSVQPHCYAPVCIYTRILAEFPPSTDN